MIFANTILANTILDRLHWLFLAIALPAMLAFALVTPPFQQPDEATHLFKAAYLSSGHVIGMKLPDHAHSGGYIDKSYQQFHEQLGRKPVPLREIEKLLPVKIGNELKFAGFPNTVQYGPFLYLPQAATLWIARQLDLTLLQSFYTVRIVTGIVAILIGFAALRIAVSGRLLLFFLLTMPMSLFLFGSISQDSLLLTGTALFIAIASRIAMSREPPTTGGALSLTALLIAISLGRPTYIVLGCIFLTRPFAHASRKHGAPIAHAGIFLLTISIIAVAAWLMAISSIQINLLPGVDAKEQIGFLLAHPLHVPVLLWNTLRRYGLVSIASFFGVLGLYHIVLPTAYYLLAVAGISLSALHDTRQPAIFATRDRLIVLAAIGAGLGATLLALYLTWTPVGASIIDGTQGRYFIPFAMMLSLCLPETASGSRFAKAAIQWAPAAVAATSAIGVVVATCTTALFFN